MMDTPNHAASSLHCMHPGRTFVTAKLTAVLISSVWLPARMPETCWAAELILYVRTG